MNRGRLVGPSVAAGLLAIALIGGLVTALVPQLTDGPASSVAAGSDRATQHVVPSSGDSPTQPTATDSSGSEATTTASPLSQATSPPTPGPTPRPTPGSSWVQDSSFVAAKMAGRVGRDSQGRVVALAQAPDLTFPPSATLATSWSGLIQEPPRTGTDDRGAAYTDYNYSSFCGAGAAAVTLYYWPGSTAAVTSKVGSFTEPVDWASPYHATTYWKATGPDGYGRGMIMYLSEVAWPAPDKGEAWWQKPGIVDWTTRPGLAATNVANLADAVNWEASGGSKLDYFYVAVAADRLSAADLRTFVHTDIHYGVPVIIAARTSDGTYALPYWNVKSTSRAVNHFVTVVGYDDAAGTYSVMDTCGPTCNDKNARAGVKTMSQAALFALIAAESDNDGVIW
ncbi:MAG: hypothetical protein ACXWNI_01345 [Candidatus Limnocylindrales bacterium]